VLGERAVDSLAGLLVQPVAAPIQRIDFNAVRGQRAVIFAVLLVVAAQVYP
jgi:hypothetical protein